MMKDTETKALSILELERTHSGSKSPLGFPQPALAPFSGRCLTKNRLISVFPWGKRVLLVSGEVRNHFELFFQRATVF